MSKLSRTIGIKYKNKSTAIFNLAFGKDGSLYLNELLSKHKEDPEYEIIRYEIPINKVGPKKNITPTERITTKHALKFSHHTSGFFQVSGAKHGSIISGYDPITGSPKGVGLNSFRLQKETNDGGPIMGVFAYGLNNISNYQVKDSSIIFQDNEIDLQGITTKANQQYCKRTAFAFMIFHVPKESLQADGALYQYRYRHYKRPLRCKVIFQENSNYCIAIACLKARCDDIADFGFRISGGAGPIDPLTGNCENISIIFPASANKKLHSQLSSLDYNTKSANSS